MHPERDVSVTHGGGYASRTGCIVVEGIETLWNNMMYFLIVDFPQQQKINLSTYSKIGIVNLTQVYSLIRGA